MFQELLTTCSVTFASDLKKVISFNFKNSDFDQQADCTVHSAIVKFKIQFDKKLGTLYLDTYY